VIEIHLELKVMSVECNLSWRLTEESAVIALSVYASTRGKKDHQGVTDFNDDLIFSSVRTNNKMR